MNDSPRPPRDPEKVTFLQTVASVMASFFGVQSRRNRERDFQRGNPLLFVAVGIGMTVLLVVGVIVLVKLVLRHAGV